MGAREEVVMVERKKDGWTWRLCLIFSQFIEGNFACYMADIDIAIRGQKTVPLMYYLVYFIT